MPLQTDSILLDVLSSDPPTPVEGQMWYNTTSKQLKTYQGGAVQASAAKNNITTTNPTVSNDSTQGYSIGSRWLNTSTNQEYVCYSASAGAAAWISSGTVSGSSSGSVRIVRVATTANLASLSGLLTVDGVTLVAGDRVLVAYQTTASQNGIYTASSGAWSYASDWVTGGVTSQMRIYPSEGATQKGEQFALVTVGNIVVGSTALEFVPCHAEVNAAGDITTTSLTDTPVTGMTVTPGTGMWQVLFSSDWSNSNNAGDLFASCFANGIKVPNSERRYVRGNQIQRSSIIVSCITQVAAGQAIDIRWRVTSATGTMGNRSLTVLKVG